MCWLSFCNWLHSRKTPSMHLHFVLCNLQSNLEVLLVLVEVKCPYFQGFQDTTTSKSLEKSWNGISEILKAIHLPITLRFRNEDFKLVSLPPHHLLALALSMHCWTSMAYWSFSHIYTHYISPIIWDDDQLLIGRLRQLRL